MKDLWMMSHPPSGDTDCLMGLLQVFFKVTEFGIHVLVQVVSWTFTGEIPLGPYDIVVLCCA